LKWKKSLDMIAETPLQSFRSIRAQIFSKELRAETAGPEQPFGE